MSKEKETEKIINDKLNSREFAFDEKAWAGMETMLDAQEKKRRFGFFWYFSASMFVVLVAGAAWFLNSPQDLKDYVDLEKKNTTLNKNEAVSGKNNITLQKNEAVSEKSNTALEKSGTVSEKSNAVLNKSETVLEKNNTALQKNETVSEKSNAVLNKSETVLEKNNTALQKNETVSKKNNAVLNKSETVLEKSETVSEKNNTVLNQNSAVSEQKDIFSAELAADSAKTAEQTLLIDSASLAETAQNPLTAPGKETKNAWGIMAGAGYWFPYQTTLGASTNEGRFGFTGGIYYRRILHKRWELGLSAIYSSRGALDFDKTYTNTNYGFGIESDKTTVSPKTLHYLNIPFAIRFNATPRSHFYIGGAYYQLLATTSEVTHTIEDSFTSSVVSSEKQTGEHKGFRKNDVAAFIGYELTLFERMNLGLQVSYGFYDITNDSYQKHDDIILKGFDRNISLHLQLKYDLIRH
jgi:hypothetical protein